jgi:hypothetical protein
MSLSVEQTRVEVLEAWRISGLRTTKFEGFMRLIQSLMYVRFRCPDECQAWVDAAILNAERRALYLPLRSTPGAGKEERNV